MSADRYTGELPPSRFNLARYCLADKPAEKTALIVAGDHPSRWSYGALEDMVLRMAEGLRREGLEQGQRLFIRMQSSVDYALLYFAANAAGAMPIPTSPQLTAEEVAFLLAASKPAFIAWDGVLDLPAHQARLLNPNDIGRLKKAPRGAYAETGCDDPAYLIFTSGSSGRPKGVLHAQRAVWGRRPMYQGWYGMTADDAMLHTGAFNWTYTMGAGLCDPFANGATAIVYSGPRDNAVWVDLIEAHGATIFASVPGLYRQLLRDDFKPGPSLRHGLVAGEALPVSLLERWQRGTGLPLFEALGMSEISTYISSSPMAPTRPGSPGKVQPGRAVRISDADELAVHRSDPGLMLGYLGEAFSGEWFATGDLGRFDEDGYFWYEGRADDMMNAGGYRVSPLEVEAVLMRHPEVADAGVREWRVSDTLTIVAAFVVPAEGRSPSEENILAFVREHLAAYKCPKQLWLVPVLPRNANGKLIRKAMTPP